jgi:catechol 2,3-dioxygenase-like lactoylglutathione lyase family enzyme
MKLAPPNHAGFSMGHVHIMLPDISTARHAFLALGGAYVRDLGRFEIIPFPGAYVLLSKAESSGGSADSLVSSFSFHVRSLSATLKACQAGGVKIANVASRSRCTICLPGDVVVELVEFSSVSDPIQFSAIHFSSDASDGMAAWYGRLLGGEVTQVSPGTTIVKIPGAELRFAKKDSPGLATKGRCLDHIGFEVSDIGQLYARYAGNGVEFESAPSVAPSGVTRVVFCNDPWGTRIELTENIAALL